MSEELSDRAERAVADPTTAPYGEEHAEHVTGPVTLRGPMIPETTTDQRLLDNRGSGDWVHTDPWRAVTRSPEEP